MPEFISSPTGTDNGTRAQNCPLLSPESVAATFLSHGSADLHPMLKSLRDEAPVFYSEDLHMWIVSRYDDVSWVLKNAELFPASTRSIIMSSYPPEVRDVLRSTSTFTAPNMGFDGSPTHDRLRKPVVPYFSAKGVKRLEARIEEIADLRAGEIPAEPPVDLVEAYARPLANTVVIRLAGLPVDDYDRIMRYHRAVNEFFFGRPPAHLQLPYAKDIQEWEEYLSDVIGMRRRLPQDDLISLLTQKVAKGEADYTDEELISLISFDVITAGFRPTSFALINLCGELLEEPHRWQALRDEPDRFDGVFSETLRRSGPALGVFRMTAAEVEVGGVPVPAGSVLWVMAASANRDERHFPEPDSFDPHRPHLAGSLHFSQGLHYCLGANLARTVIRAGITALMRHRPDLRLVPDQPRVYEPSINVVAPARLLVEW
ncbi:cytochrome P450 [Streptomyces sp. NPDC053079]|uniref:cytochrome P450 n=1 Tax=Streptomyces sp. NPDC053079 TaxID=3365697 RepID=UPI0037D309C9